MAADLSKESQDQGAAGTAHTGETERDALGVKTFLGLIKQPIKDALPGTYTLAGDVETVRSWVDGQGGKHLFVTLVEKTDGQTYNLKVRIPPAVCNTLEDGGIKPSTKLLVIGKVNLSKNEISLDASSVEDIGLGRLYRLIEGWRKQYKPLFERPKKSLPVICTKIAIISNKQTQGFEDFDRYLRYGQAVLRSTTMQGDKTAESIAAAIQEINARGGVDIIVIVRGGGASSGIFEYNLPCLLEAVAASNIPVGSAVGHESDVPLLDLAADVRYGTPTHAAKSLTDQYEKLLESIRKAGLQIEGVYAGRLDVINTRLVAVLNEINNAASHRYQLVYAHVVKLGEMIDRTFDAKCQSRLQAVNMQLDKIELAYRKAGERLDMQKRHRSTLIVAAVVVLVLLAIIIWLVRR